MRLAKQNDIYFIEEVFPGEVKSGFTAPGVEGHLPEDMAGVSDAIGASGGIAYMDQVHGDEVHTVEGAGQYRGDGLFTLKKGLLLTVKTADCLPLLLHNPDSGVSGIIHVGWRSAGMGILDKTGMDLSGFRVLAGVGLRRCCYEVGTEFRDHERLGSFLEERNGRIYFDPLGFVRNSLEQQGVSPAEFFDTGTCSCCSPGEFHSFRRDGTSKRTLSFIADMG